MRQARRPMRLGRAGGGDVSFALLANGGFRFRGCGGDRQVEGKGGAAPCITVRRGQMTNWTTDHPGEVHLKVLRNWRRICLSNKSLLREITVCQDSGGFWVGFTEVSREGPDRIVYLPATHILPLADALERVSECKDRTYLFVPCPVFGKDAWGKPARLNGVAYMMASFRYRPVAVFNGREGIWSAQFVSGRHARLVARLLRRLHQRYGVVSVPQEGR